MRRIKILETAETVCSLIGLGLVVCGGVAVFVGFMGASFAALGLLWNAANDVFDRTLLFTVARYASITLLGLMSVTIGAIFGKLSGDLK